MPPVKKVCGRCERFEPFCPDEGYCCKDPKQPSNPFHGRTRWGRPIMHKADPACDDFKER